jgi:hypothetical protein
MTEIKTWQQRCMEHHQNGQMVSEGMLRARMFEEIEELRAEVERPRAKLADRDRRERIATACLAGLLAHPSVDEGSDEMSVTAVRFADALIARLDEEAKL